MMLIYVSSDDNVFPFAFTPNIQKTYFIWVRVVGFVGADHGFKNQLRLILAFQLSLRCCSLFSVRFIFQRILYFVFGIYGWNWFTYVREPCKLPIWVPVRGACLSSTLLQSDLGWFTPYSCRLKLLSFSSPVTDFRVWFSPNSITTCEIPRQRRYSEPLRSHFLG